jgi:hypothetical protein
MLKQKCAQLESPQDITDTEIKMTDEEKRIKESVQAAYIQARLENMAREMYNLSHIYLEMCDVDTFHILTPEQVKHLKKQLNKGLKFADVATGSDNRYMDGYKLPPSSV